MDATGYDPQFLGEPVPLPTTPSDDDAPLLHSTHFSVRMHRQRRLAWYSAWNIDGLRFFPDIPRERDFFPDDRLPLDEQTTEAVYTGNDLDRGHLARRADLLWGTYEQAKQANRDSFCFTNITPQMAGFNQAGRGGVWGELENGVLDLDDLQERRLTVLAGPVLADDDPLYRDLVRLPREHWKIVVYRVDGTLRSRAFLLTQSLDGLQSAYLDGFETYEVAIATLAARTGLGFDGIPASPVREFTPSLPRRITTLGDIAW